MAKKRRPSRAKQLKFKEAKKKLQRMKKIEATRIPMKQEQRWSDVETPLPTEKVETEHDPDYVAFCVSRSLDAADDIDCLWLRVAAALKLKMYKVKNVDRSGILREFDAELFAKTLEDGDWDHEYGLRYEADKFMVYLLYGSHPRFRELFGYILIPEIKSGEYPEISLRDYERWARKQSSRELAEKLMTFDLAEVE